MYNAVEYNIGAGSRGRIYAGFFIECTEKYELHIENTSDFII